MRIAHTLEVDHVKGQLRIDGLAFPYHVEEAPEVDVIDGRLGVVRVGIYAHNVSVITADGTSTTTKAPDYIEQAWAAQRGKEIVRDGLADVLTWLDKAHS